MYGYVYKVTNVDTGRYYIGQHKYFPDEDFMDYLGTSSHPDFDLNHWDRKCFVKELLAEAETSSELLELEAKYIRDNLGKPGNVNNIKGIGFGGKYGYTDEEWAKISNPKNSEYLDYCEKCGSTTVHYSSGVCKSCIGKITYETNSANKYFKKTYKEKYCPKCRKITKHSGKNFENCASCYNTYGYNLVIHNGKVALRNGTNIVIEDVSFIINTKKEGTSFVMPDGLYVTDRDKRTSIRKVIKNVDVSNWLQITFYGTKNPIVVTEDHPFVTDFSDFVKARDLEIDQCLLGSNGRRIRIKEIRPVDKIDDSYDLETDSGFFNFSSIRSRNCRTRVIGNVYDPSREISNNRGNLSFTTINLPRLGIEAKGDINKFFKMLDEKINLVIDQLLDRFEFQSHKRVYNFPFLMGQHNWIDSEKLNITDEVGEILKHGTLSVGFIGLAETLVALTGKHHGESKESQALGLKIIKHMRDKMDAQSQKVKMNFTLLATPAEGLSGRFVKMDKQIYGEIPGITDKDYYTNSFHIPVYYNISAYDKIRIEAPYHALTNAGHISYIEMDGDPTQNLEAFEKVIRCMKESGIGYGSVNHPVDRDPVCGFTGVIGDTCPACGRKDTGEAPFERIRRITGYLVGTLDRFNNAKRAEVEDRVKHTTRE